MKRRRFNMTRRRRVAPKSGSMRLIRWSNKNTTTNCHLELTGNATLPSGDGTTTFSLSDVAGSGELVALFDNFRVLKVLYRFVLLRDVVAGPAGTGQKGIYPRITWKHDFNDSTSINRTQMYQCANMKEAFFTDNYQKTRWFSLRPAMLTQAYESGVATAYAPKWRQWLDTSDQATPHYGIKYNYSELYDGVSIRMEAKLILECKGVS